MHWSHYILIGIVILLMLVYIGLPPLLNLLGLHPSYDIPPYNLTDKRALIVTTSHNQLGQSGKKTGVFGSEMTVPYYAFLNTGMDVDIASIKGGEIPIEPFSMGWPLATKDDYHFKKDENAMSKLKNSIPIKDIDPKNYDVIFIAGGWGAAYDLAQSKDLAKVVTEANRQRVILGSICHGALGLVSGKSETGESLLANRTVTGVTNRQIKQLGIEITPKHPETELRKAGAIFESQTAFIEMMATHVSVDGNLVTGQNQNSGYETSHRILEKLSQR